jgi:hypothetical protein
MKKYFITLLKKIFWHWQIFQKYQSIARNHDHWVLLIVSQKDAAKLMEKESQEVKIGILKNMSSPIQMELYRTMIETTREIKKKEVEKVLANLQLNENEGGIQ